MDEERRRNRTGDGAENLPLTRRPAPNNASFEPGKYSMRVKRQRTAWREENMIDLTRARQIEGSRAKLLS